MSFHAQSSSESACFLSRVQVGKSVDVTHVYISCRFGHNGSALSSNVLVRILNDGPNRYLFCVTRRDLFLSCTVVIELLAKLIDQSPRSGHIYISCRFGHNGSALSPNVLAFLRDSTGSLPGCHVLLSFQQS